MTPTAPTTTDSGVKPSMRAWTASATRAAEPIFWPMRIRQMATASLPAKPMTPATMIHQGFWMGCGWMKRQSFPSGRYRDRATTATMNSPARSAARP